MDSYPQYPKGWTTILHLLISVPFKGRLSFRQEALACISGLQPPLRIYGLEYIPKQGPCVVTPNHYYRRGFQAWWIALAVSSVVPQEMHWVMTSALRHQGSLAWILNPLTRQAIRWIAKAFEFTTMPPIPPDPLDTTERARSVRRVLAYAKSHPLAIIGLVPEGGDSPDGKLQLPPSGAGRFIFHLNKMGFEIVPAGVYEDDGALCLHFGQVLNLNPSMPTSPDVLDVQVRREVIQSIASLLPESLRGTIS